ncbi:hypothetical protein B0H17DRAFT_1042896 [Mycena rosella]|uniref:Uncharacterized protein n=1 Tax=Mycena rosella TaxID=1033263 RepID=A0AAD7GND2_MYCRO|nr:hypothetical protein B0H17DRAFT_1042896 [Mycena rosella]
MWTGTPTVLPMIASAGDTRGGARGVFAGREFWRTYACRCCSICAWSCSCMFICRICRGTCRCAYCCVFGCGYWYAYILLGAGVRASRSIRGVLWRKTRRRGRLETEPLCTKETARTKDTDSSQRANSRTRG